MPLKGGPVKTVAKGLRRSVRRPRRQRRLAVRRRADRSGLQGHAVDLTRVSAASRLPNRGPRRPARLRSSHETWASSPRRRRPAACRRRRGGESREDGSTPRSTAHAARTSAPQRVSVTCRSPSLGGTCPRSSTSRPDIRADRALPGRSTSFTVCPPAPRSYRANQFVRQRGLQRPRRRDRRRAAGSAQRQRGSRVPRLEADRELAAGDLA